MSYHTQFILEHDVPEDEHQELVESLARRLGHLATHLADGFMVHLPWREHEEDMLRTSKLFRDNNFILTGHGDSDEDMDLWKKLFRCGAVYEERAQITWEDFAPGLPVDLLSR